MQAIITEREIKALDFQVIRERLAALAATPMARDKALEMMPSADFGAVERALREADEGRILCSRGSFQPAAVEDVAPLAGRAAKGGVLSSMELAKIMFFLKAVRRCRNFFKDRDQRETYPLLSEMCGALDGCPALSRRLEQSVDEAGSVLDGASPLLQDLRRRQRALQESIRARMDAYIRSSTYSRYLQEPIVTIRNGRFVLPVKQEYRNSFPGVLHDQSGSGATLFIEPMPVVQMQNELVELARREEREIERLLAELSSLTAQAAVQLRSDRDIYAELDFIAARGRLSLETAGAAPRLAQGEPCLEIKEGRHPLLGSKAVPLTLTLGGCAGAAEGKDNGKDAGGIRTLLITGPNTGGKTVALKTAGLLAVMVQCGLHVPADAASVFSVFNCLRADIGDEQSIAQSLSTFSGHIKNIIDIISEVKTGSLVLLDELGAGTDPSEGAALAMSILDALNGSGALTLATTHSSELKLFAQVQEGMQNASMEFDQETLCPTYRLLQGVPGQSNAFIIAERLGMPAGVLQKARGFLQRDHAEVESVIASLVEDRQRYHRDSKQAAQDKAHAMALLREAAEEREKLRARREEILQQAREEARWMIRRARSTVDELLRELHRIRDEAGPDSFARAEKVRQELRSLQEELGPKEEEEQPAPLPAEELAAGKIVLVRSLRQKGEILSLDDEGAYVQIGRLKVHTPLGDLASWRQDKEQKTVPAAGGYSLRKQSEIRSSVDLRGRRVEEALPEVEKLIDNALLAGLNQVVVIHGKGTGKLKEGLRSYLQEHSQVKEIRAGLPGEGGDGVTVVRLKN